MDRMIVYGTGRVKRLVGRGPAGRERYIGPDEVVSYP